MLASTLPPTLFDTYSLCYLWNVRPLYCHNFSCLQRYLLKFFPSQFQNDLNHLTAKVIIHLMRFFLHILVSRSFVVRLRYSFLFLFFPYPLVSWSLLPIFPNTCNFSFYLSVLFLSLFGRPISNVICLFLLLLSYAKFHPYILTVYSYCMYESL